MENSGIEIRRIQFEVRFNPIIDFSFSVRPILAKFVKLSSRYEIKNINVKEEFIALHFDADHFLIDVRWDRMLFVSAIECDSTLNLKGSIEIFFQIFNEISNLDSFGNIYANIFMVHATKLVELDERKTVLELFKDRFMNISNFKFPGLMQTEDVGIIIESNGSHGFTSIQMGPFKGEKDIEAHNLAFGSLGNLIKPEINPNSILAVYSRNIESSKFNKDTFRSIGKRIKEDINDIFSNV